MAEGRTRGKRRVRGALRVFARTMRNGERWWWVHVPGDERRALGLRAAEVPYEEAYRVACERFAVGALTAGKDGTQWEATLDAITEAFVKEEGPRYKPRARRSVSLRANAFVEAMLRLKVTRPGQITDAALAAWVEERLDHGITSGTINRDLTVARTMLRWAAKHTPPFCGPTPLDARKNLREIERAAPAVIPSPAEWRHLVATLAGLPCPIDPSTLYQRTHWRANCRGAALLVAVAVQTGLRLDELRHLRAEDVRDGSVTVAAHDGWSPKSWQERTVPVPAETAMLARELVAWRDEAVGLNGRALVVGDHWIADLLDAAWSSAHLAGHAPRMHDCRRTFATELSRRGEPLTVVRDRLGHQDVQTTERYLGAYRDDPARVVPDLGVGSVLVARDATVIPIGRKRG